MNRLIASILFLFVFLTAAFGEGERKKVGLILAGGGALGVAHVGVLKVLEEAEIPIDYISGTSMGALIGALYAIGYTAAELDSIVTNQNWRNVFSNKLSRSDLPFYEKIRSDRYLITIPVKNKKIEVPTGIINTQNIHNLIQDYTIGYHDSLSFDSLPIPFACVATNVLTGEAYVFRSGQLPIAMRASMSIPGVFSPVVLDDMVLVDGGVVNNFPVNICRDMGADILIGVDLARDVKKDTSMVGISAVINQLVDYLGVDEYTANRDYLLKDSMNAIYIHPNLNNYTIASFTKEAIDSMVLIGEQTAREHWNQLMEIKKLINGKTTKQQKQLYVTQTDSYFIKDIFFRGIPFEQIKSLKSLLRLKENSIITKNEITQSINYLYGTGNYKSVDFQLQAIDNRKQYNLIFDLRLRTFNTINIGVRFDTETVAGILLNTSIHGWIRKYTTSEFTARLSINPYFNGKITWGKSFLHRYGIIAHIQYNNLDLYEKGKKMSNLDFLSTTATFNYSFFSRQDLSVVVNFLYDYYKFGTILYSPDYDQTPAKSKGYFNYEVGVNYETLNEKYFPTKGWLGKLKGTFYTTNTFNNSGKSPFGSVRLSTYGVTRLFRNCYCIPSFYGRVLIGNDVPLQYQNCMGGIVAERFFAQQIPFYGITHLELFDNSLLNIGITLRYKIKKLNYVSISTNYAKTNQELYKIQNGKNMWGGGISYAYNSLFGPLDATISVSNWDKNLGIYISLGYYF